jgi:hypothetical protein
MRSRAPRFVFPFEVDSPAIARRREQAGRRDGA